MWARLWWVLGSRRNGVAILAIASALSGLTEAGVLAAVAQIASDLVNHRSQMAVHLGPLHLDASIAALLVGAAGLAVLRLSLQAIVSVVPARIASEVQAEIRGGLFGAFTRATWGVQARDREGDLQELATNQANQATLAIIWAMQLINALMTLLVLIISAVLLNFVAAIAVLVSAGALFVLLRPLSSLGRRYGQAVSRNAMAYASGVGEAVRTAEETKVFGVTGAQRQRIAELIDQIRQPFFRAQLLLRLIPGVYQSLIYLLVVGALAVVYVAKVGNVGSLGAVVLLLVRAGTYGQATQLAHQAVIQLLPYLEQVQQAQARYQVGAAVRGGRELRTVTSLTLSRVYFAYEPNQPVLSDVSFEVNGGEAVGIVGPSGAGKSTLLQILLRLRDPRAGDYLVNGVRAGEYASKDWHERVAYVPQEPKLLHASVRHNIAFYRDLDEPMVQKAAELAGIHDEILSWPDGYDTIIGPRADAISGGQQQRICLARALAARPSILVLDEPTSALDPHSERLIQRSLATVRRGLTLFVVAHRMSTLDVCERVMVIRDGRLEAFDAVDRLRQNNAYFRSASRLTGGAVLAETRIRG